MHPVEPRRRIAIIVNPISGRGSAMHRVNAVAKHLHAMGSSAEIRTTRGKGHATELARQLSESAEAILAVGGDGTVCEVVNGLIHSKVPLSVLGMGTENLIAKEFRMSTHPVDVARTLLHGRQFPCDVGIANHRKFMAIVGIGFDAECVQRLTRTRRGHITHFDYFFPIFRAFFAHQFPRLQVTIDGKQLFDGRGLVLIGMIARYSIGLRPLARAKHDDGLLDVCVLPCDSKWQLLQTALRIARKAHLTHPSTIYRQCKSVRVTSPGQALVQIDGDVGGECPMECSIIPGAIQCLTPT